MIDSVDRRLHESYTNALIDSILNDCIQNGRQIGGYRHSYYTPLKAPHFQNCFESST